MGMGPSPGVPPSSSKDYAVYIAGLQQEIVEGVLDRLMEREAIQEALRTERLKTAFSDYNRGCLVEVGGMIDKRIEAFFKTDFRELRKDFDAFVAALTKNVDEIHAQLGGTMSRENGDKTVGKIAGINDRITTLSRRMSAFEDDINKKIDGYSDRGVLVPGIMLLIRALTERVGAIEAGIKTRGKMWRYLFDMAIRITPILISIGALAFAIYSKG